MKYIQPFFVAVLTISLLFQGRAGADQPARAPVLLMVRVGQSQAAQEMESRFVTDLGLYVEGFSIQETPSPAEGFVETPLGRQIALIKPLMVQRRAVAAMWLHAVSEDVLLLQVVVLDTGRALIRLFEHSLIEGSQEALAATAAELLGTAYLFDQDKADKSESIKELVDTTRERAGAKASRPSKWRLLAAAFGQAGFLDNIGPSLGIGGIIGADRVIADDFFLTLGVGGVAGPLGRENGSTLRGYEVHMRIDGFWGPSVGPIRFGPALNLYGGPASVMVVRPGFPREDYAHWTLHGGIGMELRVSVHEKVSFKVASGISASPTRLAVKLRSTDDTVYRKGILSGWLTLGILLF